MRIMAHFAQVKNGFVTNVIVAEKDFIDSGVVGDPSEWIQTSYNTKGGVHYDLETGQPDGGIALRANYAGVGYTYDAENDVFYGPQPFPSWTISAPSWVWQPPIPMPLEGGPYEWDEQNLTWSKA